MCVIVAVHRCVSVSVDLYVDAGQTYCGSNGVERDSAVTDVSHLHVAESKVTDFLATFL